MPSPYRAVNTFHLGYKNQSVYAVSGTSRCLFSDKYKTHQFSVGRAYSCWMLNCLCITWPVGFKQLRRTDPSGRVVLSVGLRPLACWDCRFESRQGHGCSSFVSVVCCQVEVCAMSWSPFQGSPTDCGASLCVTRNLLNEEAMTCVGPRRRKKQNYNNKTLQREAQHVMTRPHEHDYLLYATPLR